LGFIDERKFLVFVGPSKAPQTPKRQTTAVEMERSLSGFIIGSKFAQSLAKWHMKVKNFPFLRRISPCALSKIFKNFQEKKG
jgi:hypothetical protein